MMAKGLIVSLCGAFVMACSGCGGGGGGANPTPQIKTAPKPVQIAAMGDSTMAGVVCQALNTGCTPTGVYTADVQTLLQQQLGNPGITIVNRSINATTLADNISGGNGYTQGMVAYLSTDTTSKIVVENYAINDLRYETVDQFRDYLVQFITNVRAVGKQPVLEEPNPLCHPATAPQNVEETDVHGQTMAAYVDVIDQVAAQYGVPLVAQYKPILALPNWCALISDGWAHPTPQLYAIKAQNEAAVLGPLVKSLM